MGAPLGNLQYGLQISEEWSPPRPLQTALPLEALPLELPSGPVVEVPEVVKLEEPPWVSMLSHGMSWSSMTQLDATRHFGKAPHVLGMWPWMNTNAR